MKELIVSVMDQPGELNKIAAAFGKAGVNIMAVALFTIAGEGQIHLAVNDAEKGKKELEKLKYTPTAKDVLLLEVEHKTGALAHMTDLLAKAKINITLLYGSGSTSPSAQLVMGVSDYRKATKILGLE